MTHRRTTARQKHRGIGITLVDGEIQQHFLVIVPQEEDIPVSISEHSSWGESEALRDENTFSHATRLSMRTNNFSIRVLLSHEQWNAILPTVAATLRASLAHEGKRAGRWGKRTTVLSRDVGRELLILAWGIEQVDVSSTRTALKNWQGLQPVERCWLYAMVARSPDAVTFRGRGRAWRMALECLLTENPVSDGPVTGFPPVHVTLPFGGGDSAKSTPTGEIDALLPRITPVGRVVSAAPMGSAPMRYDDNGQVAWGEMWTTFCDLALSGGPPHRGELLEPVSAEEVERDPAAYQRIVAEIERGVGMTTGLPTCRSVGWVGVVCPDEDMARWLLQAVVAENVCVRREGATLYVPAGPAFRVDKEVKNVITVLAKTVHYWTEHQL